MKMISLAYLTLNASRPDLTNGCWLYYNIRLPYYEAVAFSLEFNMTADVSACRWQQQPGAGRLTVGSITGIGTCIGAVPETYQHLCNHAVPTANLTNHTHQWIIPPENGWWASSAGLTPCAHQVALKTSLDFCVLVHLVPRLNYYSEEELQLRLETPGQYRVKREPVTALTLTVLLGLGAIGTGSGIAALTLQDKPYNQLRAAIDEDIEQLEKSISHLQESLSSLAEVVLQKIRGLDLLFLQGGLCAALGEECCFYIDHSGVVQ